ncbi:hypothetical protein [Ruegeria arenilitoris]|uniref:hypothetical protein n=1 Tax=Ruegeria arenilitoris TaxID=1173585 RepID=UPI00148073A6|nr:hypothetical protein [Ruegeria arenilitoris]
MARSFWQFWLFFIPGIAVSHLISIFSHDLMSIPRGVPFGRFGIIGAIAQISLLLLPFAIGASLAAMLYFKRYEAKSDPQEVLNCAKKIGGVVLILTFLFFALSGAWFGLIQAPGWMIVVVLFAPALAAAVTFWVVFPSTISLIVFGRNLS